MKFVKMHGLGNDFVFLEDKNAGLARKMCAPHTGIGADGIIVIVLVIQPMYACGLLMPMAVKRKCAAMASALCQICI